MLIGALVLPWSGLAQDRPAPEATISALQTQVALLEGEVATPTPVATPEASAGDAAAAADVAEPAAPRTVNLEIVLDDSGSMGQLVDTGETRLEAAKRVLDEVLAAIPTEPGVNVGLRIYGHLGDNTDAGRPISCEASELIVPVSGVDRAAIAQSVAPLVPVGWTPIALSLGRAESDFPDPAEGTTNAVVLVTDGLETCGGDPAAAAGALVSGEKGIVTHVIGFAVTPEEQQILEGITEASGGMLLGATNANELSAALFSVLEELKIVVGQGYVGGNAFPLIPAGAPGEVSVVASGAPDPSSGSVPFVVRNNTDGDVYDVRVIATAKDASGRVVATGDDQGVRPFHVQPGTLGLGHVYFDGLVLPADTAFEFVVETAPADELRYKRTRDLEVVEASLFEDRIVGQIENPQDGDVEGLIGITVTCFDPSGFPLGDSWEFVETNRLAPGEMVPFQAAPYLARTLGCPAFLVAGNGQCDSCTPISVDADAPREASAPADQSGGSGASEDDTPPANEREAAMLAQDPLPGYADAAQRYFRFTGGGFANLAFVSYSVLAFGTPEQADAALEETASRYLAMREEPLLNLLPAAPPDLGDRAIAFTGEASDPQFDFRVGIVAIRDGARIHFLIGSQMNQSPLPLMEQAAEQGLLPVDERAREELTVTGLNAGGLWEAIPRPEDLGEGFLVEDEFVPKMFGPVFGGGTGTPQPAGAG
jgi:hypothetical protein